MAEFWFGIGFYFLVSFHAVQCTRTGALEKECMCAGDVEDETRASARHGTRAHSHSRSHSQFSILIRARPRHGLRLVLSRQAIPNTGIGHAHGARPSEMWARTSRSDLNGNIESSPRSLGLISRFSAFGACHAIGIGIPICYSMGFACVHHHASSRIIPHTICVWLCPRQNSKD